MTRSVPALTAEAAESAVEVSWTAVGGAARYELWVWDRVNDWAQIGGNSLRAQTTTRTLQRDDLLLRHAQ